MKVDFVDAQKMAKKYPATFEVPSMEVLSLLAPGDLVKVGTNGEQFWVWVRLTEVSPRRLRGVVHNDLLRAADLKYGDKIDFEPRHVCDWMPGEELS